MDRDAVLEQFRKFDKDGDGRVTHSELARVLKSLDRGHWTEQRIEGLLKVIDKNNDGNINFEEFITWVFGEAKRDRNSQVFSQEVRDAAETRVNQAFRAAYGAAKAGDMENMWRLIAADPVMYVNMQQKSCGSTLLHQVAAHGYTQDLEKLLKLGADTTIKNNDGLVAEDLCSARSEHIVQMLRASGRSVIATIRVKREAMADVAAQNEKEKPALKTIADVAAQAQTSSSPSKAAPQKKEIKPPVQGSKNLQAPAQKHSGETTASPRASPRSTVPASSPSPHHPSPGSTQSLSNASAPKKRPPNASSYSTT